MSSAVNSCDVLEGALLNLSVQSLRYAETQSGWHGAITGAVACAFTEHAGTESPGANFFWLYDAGTTVGQDLNLSMDHVVSSRNFGNQLWNAGNPDELPEHWTRSDGKVWGLLTSPKQTHSKDLL